MRFRISSLLLAAALALAGPATADDKTKVTIGEQTWTGATAVQYVLAVMLEKYFNAEVDSVAAAEEFLWAAMDKGDGSVDILPDVWSDHLVEQMNKYVVPGSRETVIFNATPYLGTEGIFIPGFVQDEHGIKKITDLANPEIAKLFDIDGDGKGDWWPGAIGWDGTSHSLVRAKSYGFADYFEPTTVEQPVFLTQLKAAMVKKQPILFYYWTPEWIFAAYDLRKLEEPPFDGYRMAEYQGSKEYNANGCYDFYQPVAYPDWLEKSNISCDQPATHVYIAHSKELAERAPQIAQFLSQIVLTPELVNQWIYAIDIDGKAPRAMAEEWVAANTAVVEGEWLKGIAR